MVRKRDRVNTLYSITEPILASKFYRSIMHPFLLVRIEIIILYKPLGKFTFKLQIQKPCGFLSQIRRFHSFGGGNPFIFDVICIYNCRKL